MAHSVKGMRWAFGKLDIAYAVNALVTLGIADDVEEASELMEDAPKYRPGAMIGGDMSSSLMDYVKIYYIENGGEPFLNEKEVLGVHHS